MRDKMWFWTSYRNMGNKTSSGQYRDVDPLDWVYTPNTSEPTDAEQLRNQNYSARVILAGVTAQQYQRLHGRGSDAVAESGRTFGREQGGCGS